ncbi:translocation/assembly module TamB domain-containing protein [Flavobacterium sp. FZUC8N2.13]|uniref:Translocation/assembly module TamB domain-containing protein n=1 Tax=Flavobacterium zubiriense TaxID=3138075 RepID=A0ABV4TAN4_9FLAO
MLGIALTLPTVQTKVAKYLMNRINSDFNTHIAIDKVKLSIFGGVKIQNVLILDHHKDTLIYSKIVNTSIFDVNSLLEGGNLLFKKISLDGVVFDMKTYKNEKKTNMDVFIAAFDSGKPPSAKHFLLKSDKAFINNGRFRLFDENKPNPKDVDFKNINTELTDFKLYGPDVNTIINKLSFLDHRGLFVEKLSTVFSYSKKKIQMEDLEIETPESKIKAEVKLTYQIEDFVHFNDKVKFDVKINSASIATNDIRYFYKELGINQFFYINKADIKGTLNDLYIYNLGLVDSRKSRIDGAINFKNIFGKKDQHFYMDGDFTRINTSYDNLVMLLPNVLGKKLPIELKTLGNVFMEGTAQLSPTALDAVLNMNSEIGRVQAVVSMTNIDFIDKAAYTGNVVFENFDVGTFLNRKDLGKVTMDIDVDGKGFTEKFLNTELKGIVSKIDYNTYTYNNITVNGNFKLPYYKGQISVADPNLAMEFDGLLDLSAKENKYDFHVNVDHANLTKLKIVKDTVSNFKGDVVVQLTGNTIENLQGNVYIKETSYQNVKDTYIFDDFNVNSTFDANGIRTITINSPDIVDGKVVGRFQFSQLGKLARNSMGSLYTNFKPEKVNKGQFLQFNFTIYSKIVEILYPEIELATNTVLRGNIKSDNQEFKMNFNSPNIKYAKNSFDNIRVAIDNKNPLYNAYVELDSIKTPYYKVRDFSLINITTKDTLLFRSEFKGGEKGEDFFTLNLYHTIDEDNNNVLGISKSEMKFKENFWYLNAKDTPDNKIVFDKSLKNFNFDDIILSHKEQSVSLRGTINENSKKDLELSFNNVDLYKITPSNNKFVFNGNLNGSVHFKQNNQMFKPIASLVVDKLNINNTDLGILKFNIEGDENLEKFTINSYLENESIESSASEQGNQSLSANGSFEIVNKKTILDLKVKLDRFNLGILSPLGGNVLSNIRGQVTGNSIVTGDVNKPKISGRLFVDKAGITVPYLNVDYQLSDRSIVDLVDETFLFRNNTITDSKFNTKGVLSGSVEHNNFTDWKLDFNINSKRLVVLDTKDAEDAAYYGTAFINGNASIKGPVSGLFIKIVAKSEEGTDVKIPINYAESVGENSFIHFLTPKEKFNKQMGIVENNRKYNGLELEFDLDITPEAEVEVILDRNSGHGMKGKGYGSLLFKINTLGRFNMWGDFQAYEGTYNFKYGGLIDKKFDVKKGGSITWEGNPMRAQLNLQAVYKTIANPAVLLDNSSFNRKVPVDVIIGIQGDLASPEPNFNIEFPTVSNVLKSEIQYKLYDKDVRQTQALYLLSSGGFLSPEGVNQSDFSGSLFETASSLLGDILKTDSDKIKVGLNYVSPDRRIGRETDGRVVATISSKINERISINGKVGVPFGGINESAVVGDLEVQYRVNQDGTMNLRLFNRENDINYIGQGIGYTQGLGLTYEVDFDTFSELVNKIFKKYNIRKTSNTNEYFDDSNVTPEYINFNNEKTPKKKDSKNNSEAVKTDEE